MFWNHRKFRIAYPKSPHSTIRQSGGQSRDRTGDTRIFSPVLYQLSYLPFFVFCGKLYPQTYSKNIIELRYIYVKIFIAPFGGLASTVTQDSSCARNAPIRNSAFRKMLCREGEASKLDLPIYLKVLRHSYGFKLANNGRDTWSIQFYLEHKNIQNTVPYTQISPNRFKGFWKEYVIL